jgi:hypothetical protein
MKFEYDEFFKSRRKVKADVVVEAIEVKEKVVKMEEKTDELREEVEKMAKLVKMMGEA